MAAQPQKKTEENAPEFVNGSEIKLNNKVRVSPDYMLARKQALSAKRKTEFTLSVEQSVAAEINAYVAFMSNVMDTDTTPEKIVEDFVKVGFLNDKPFVEWKKKNPQFMSYMIEQIRASNSGQPGAFFAPISSSNGNGQTASVEAANLGSGADLDDEEILGNLKEVKTT
jgi:hypothetical protein